MAVLAMALLQAGAWGQGTPAARTIDLAGNGAAADYSAQRGYGLGASPKATANGKGLQAPEYFRLDLDAAPGNYDVTATLGNPSAESTTTIRSQAHRPMIVDAHTGAGEYRAVHFTVNVNPGVGGHSGLDDDGRMHLEFLGKMPSVTRVEVTPNTTAPTIFIAGDSTACDYNSDPRVGWGSMLPLFFKPGEAAVCNLAQSGRSAKSFIAEKRQEDLFRTMKSGDFLLMQFAHNDQKDRSLTQEQWKQVLMTYVDGVKARGGTTILVAAQPRRQFDDQGKIKNSLGEFPESVRQLAREQNLGLIDLNARATVFFDALGVEASKKAFCYYPGGEFTGKPADNADNTHFTPYGAYELAKLVAHEIRDRHLAPANLLVDPLEPTNTDPAKFPASLDYNPLRIAKP
jgi:lysophospholipase L1-like esterase